MANKKSFIIYENYGKMLDTLPPETAGMVIKIMYRYQCGVPEEELAALDAIAYGIFCGMKDQMDRDNAKYEAKCEAGRKGGEAKANKRSAESFKNVAPSSKKVAKVTQKEKEIEKDSPSENNTPSLSPPRGEKNAAFSSDPVLNDAMHEFVKHRKAMRKPMTDKAVQLFANRLNKLAPGDTAKQVQLINTAIERGWQTVYEEDSGKKAFSNSSFSAGMMQRTSEEVSKTFADLGSRNGNLI